MASNDFEAFAIGPEANVPSQADWTARPVLANGFVDGVANPQEANKAIRQPSFVGAAISEWINQILLTVPIRDDGNLQEYINNFDAALARRMAGVIPPPPAQRFRPPTSCFCYVSTSGSDSNDGLTPGTPFRHIQKGVDHMIGDIDLLPGNTAQIYIAAGTYAENVSIGAMVGVYDPGQFILVSQGGVVNLSGSGYCFQHQGGALWSMTGSWYLTNNYVNGQPNCCISAIDGGRVGIQSSGVVFGPCVGGIHLFAATGAEINNYGNGIYTIAGSAVSHWCAESGGRIYIVNTNLPVSGTPDFAGSFARSSDCGVIICNNTTFSGSGATGEKFLANINGVINTGGGGVGLFPGSIAGATGSGGQYI